MNKQTCGQLITLLSYLILLVKWLKMFFIHIGFMEDPNLGTKYFGYT